MCDGEGEGGGEEQEQDGGRMGEIEGEAGEGGQRGSRERGREKHSLRDRQYKGAGVQVSAFSLMLYN